MRAGIAACNGRPALAVTSPAGKHFMPGSVDHQRRINHRRLTAVRPLRQSLKAGRASLASRTAPIPHSCRADWQVTTPSKLVACRPFRPAPARAEPMVRGLSPGAEWIRTFGSAMRSHRRQRRRGVTPTDPGGEWRLPGPPPDNSRYAEAGNRSDDRCAGRLAPTRTNPRNRCLSSAELNVRIHSAPAESQRRTDVRRLASRSARSSCSGGIGPFGFQRERSPRKAGSAEP
jgi:hypothetical protein